MNRSAVALRSSVFVVIVLAGCGGAGGGDGAMPDMTVVSADDPNPDPLCQPVNARGSDGAPGECFLPYPSSFYQKADPSSPSGYRVAVPKGVMPRNQVGRDFDTSRLNLRDGWSPWEPPRDTRSARKDPPSGRSSTDTAGSTPPAPRRSRAR